MRPVAIALVALALALPARAEPPRGKTVRLGVIAAISPRFDPADNPTHRALVEGLRVHGYEVGRHVIVDFRSAAGNPELVPAVAAEAVAAKPDILVSYGTAMTLELRKLTTTIPVVMVGTGDPVSTGVVASLTRPGGNITGIASNSAEIAAKRVQLLQEAVPKLTPPERAASSCSTVRCGGRRAPHRGVRDAPAAAHGVRARRGAATLAAHAGGSDR